MLRIGSQNELLNLFRDFEQGQVQISNDMKFPLAVIDYLAWKEPSGHRTYLVVEDKAGMQTSAASSSTDPSTLRRSGASFTAAHHVVGTGRAAR